MRQYLNIVMLFLLKWSRLSRCFVPSAKREIKRRSIAEMSAMLDRFSVAPMMDYTDRHFRFMFRLLSRRTTLYTEMITANSLVDEQGKIRKDDFFDRMLKHDDTEGLTVLQLGGADVLQLRSCAELALDYEYGAINLNCGCPSDRVAGAGCFGAAMMRTPSLTANICRSMLEVVPEVSVKCRIGVVETQKDLPSEEEYMTKVYPELRTFVDAQMDAGVRTIIVHARLAVLSGLSPDKNRQIPPLRPDLVLRLAEDYPELKVILNGEINDYEQANQLNALKIHGAMVGRDICRRPWFWAQADSVLLEAAMDPTSHRLDFLEQYTKYADHQEDAFLSTSSFLPSTSKRKAPKGHPRNRLLKPIHNLFAGDPGSTRFKRHLAENRDLSTPLSELVLQAAHEAISPDFLLRPPGGYNENVHSSSSSVLLLQQQNHQSSGGVVDEGNILSSSNTSPSSAVAEN